MPVTSEVQTGPRPCADSGTVWPPRRSTRQRVARIGIFSWVLTALLIVDVGATPHAAAASTLQGYGALQRDTTPAIVSHRGAALLAPENTLAGIEAAVQSGADFVEIDLRRTKDGRAILMHDPTLDRTTNGMGWVRDYTLGQIRSMDAGSEFDPAFAGEAVPTFEEAVAMLEPAPVAVLVELKDDWSDAQLVPVVDHLRERQMVNRVVLQSFNLATMEALQRVAPEFARALLTRELGDEVVDLALELGVSGVGAKGALYAAVPGAVEQLRAEGLGVAVYTLNTPSEWQFATDSGIDLVITDDPAALRDWHEERVSAAQSIPQ
ncbi:glycerophosphodiester phosphodiesterase [Leucobacter sp. W1478]|uniref:glycerophosphodiester phosphodiesterase n=1 Tax=Leucobacter sp. W1478 TaxID=3439065 RepID=UPI003F34A743